MAPFYPSRSASLAIAIFGIATNVVLATQVLTAWRSFKWEPESEWEASMGRWSVDGPKLMWGLLFTYFACAASICAAGFAGILKNKPSFVRFYRDYSIADFSFCTFFTVVAAYGAFGTSARAGVCEELSHHPELMRDVVEMGLNLENCERWLESAVFALVAFLIVLNVIRLHFVLAVTNYYSHLVRHVRPASDLPQYRDASGRPPSHPTLRNTQRVLLLPRSPFHPASEDSHEPVVYAPIPLSALPQELAQDIKETATEAWVSHLEPTSQSTCEYRPHRHRHHRSRRSRSSSRSSSHRTGTIALPITPGEGLIAGECSDVKA